MWAARLARPPCRLGDGDQLGRRPLALRVGHHCRLVEVLTESTGVLEELPRRDLVGSCKVGQETVDPGVEVDRPFLGQLQHDDGDEGLRDAADAPWNARIDVTAVAAQLLGARRNRHRGPVRHAHRQHRADEVLIGTMQFENVGQLSLKLSFATRRRRRRSTLRKVSCVNRRIGSGHTRRSRRAG